MSGENGRNGSKGWQAVMLAGLFAAFMAVVGWIATDAQTARNKLTDDIDEQARKVAVLEEGQRNQKEALNEIKALLEDIRRQMVERRR